jgi:hypothetical protein
MKHINIKHIDNLHNDAIRGLDFYWQELIILRHRLEEIAAGNTSQDVAEQVEHFQNQFTIHNEQIDELRHAFHENLKKVESQLVELAGFADESSFDENEELYERYVTEEKMFNELRHEFNRFAAKWL